MGAQLEQQQHLHHPWPERVCRHPLGHCAGQEPRGSLAAQLGSTKHKRKSVAVLPGLPVLSLGGGSTKHPQTPLCTLQRRIPIPAVGLEES